MFCNDKDHDNFVGLFKSWKAAATAYTKVFRKNRVLRKKNKSCSIFSFQCYVIERGPESL